MRFGIDYLGGARYESTVLKYHPKGFGAGIFSQVDGFGDGLKVIDKLLAKGNCPFVRTQLMWKDNHSFTNKDYGHVKKEAQRVRKLIAKYPHVQFYVSPVCEHRLNEKDWNKFADIVKEELQGLNYVLVNSPEKTTKFKNAINEFHHQKGGDAFSYDGANAFDSNVQADKEAYSNSVYFMFWNCQFNGKKKLDEKIPRPQRKAWPVKEHIESCVALAKDKGAVKIPAKWLLKSHSDQHTDKPAGKDCKPVWIIPSKNSEIVIKDSSGKVVAVAKYYGPFQSGGHRYYHSDWGYKIAKGRVLDVFLNGKKVGTINLAFREGGYR